MHAGLRGLNAWRETLQRARNSSIADPTMSAACFSASTFHRWSQFIEYFLALHQSAVANVVHVTNAGMYSHIKALSGMGASDIPVGTSIQTEGAAKAAASRDKASIDVKDSAAVAKAVAAAVKTSNKSVGAAKVHGFGGGGRGSIHNHEDSFQRRKGVVNTIGGAKDVTRVSKEEPARLPPKGERKGAQIMGFSTLDAHTAEGKARREAAEKRESAGNGYKMTSVHVAGGGGRSMASSGAAPAHRPSASGSLSVSSSAASSAATAQEPRKAITAVLGGNNSAGNAQPLSADEVRAKRAAHFEKMAAEAAAKKHAAAVAAGLRTA